MPTSKNKQSPAELLYGRSLSLPFIPRSILINNTRNRFINSAKSNQRKYQSRVKRNFDKHVPKQPTFHSRFFKRNDLITSKLQQQYICQDNCPKESPVQIELTNSNNSLVEDAIQSPNVGNSP
ncbi:hypothetical protein A3Q56_08545, partial [Intoshia linei]